MKTIILHHVCLVGPISCLDSFMALHEFQGYTMSHALTGQHIFLKHIAFFALVSLGQSDHSVTYQNPQKLKLPEAGKPLTKSLNYGNYINILSSLCLSSI